MAAPKIAARIWQEGRPVLAHPRRTSTQTNGRINEFESMKNEA
jgi:hypothetical protein